MIEHIRYWFWPFFVAVYPWLFVVGRPHSPYLSYLEHYVFTAIMLFLWLLLNFNALMVPRQQLGASLTKYKPVLFALLFGVWVLVSSAFSSNPIVSLTGNINTLRGSAIFIFILSLVFAAVYFDVTRGKLAPRRVYWSLIASASLFSAFAFFELFRGQGFFYTTTSPYPVVLFPGPGHLAGFLSMAIGVLSGLWSTLTLPALFLLALGLGMTFNRTSLGASTLAVLLNFAKPWALRILLIIVLFAGVVGGWQAVEHIAGQGRSDFVKATTMEERYAYWRIARNGILQRPIFGWGGGQISSHLSTVADERDIKTYLFTPSEEAEGKILYANGDFFTVEYPDGRRENKFVVDWAPHNFILDIALSWGMIGLVIYLLLLIPALFPALSGSPAALGLLSYHAFLLLWPSTIEAVGVLWVLWSISSAERITASAGK